jgi:hypothetical protein
MRRHGIPQNVLDDWADKADEGTTLYAVILDKHLSLSILELNELVIHSWHRFRMLWGLRKRKNDSTDEDHQGDGKRDEDEDGNGNGNTQESFLDTDLNRWKPHRQIHVYATQEEAIAARRKKLSTVGKTVEPYVLKVADERSQAEI